MTFLYVYIITIQWFIVTLRIYWFPKNTMTCFPFSNVFVNHFIIWLLVLHCLLYLIRLLYEYWADVKMAEIIMKILGGLVFNWTNEFVFLSIVKTRYLQTPVNNFIEWNSFHCFFFWWMLANNLFLNNDLFSWLNLIHKIGVSVL